VRSPDSSWRHGEVARQRIKPDALGISWRARSESTPVGEIKASSTNTNSAKADCCANTCPDWLRKHLPGYRTQLISIISTGQGMLHSPRKVGGLESGRLMVPSGCKEGDVSRLVGGEVLEASVL